MKIIKGFLLSLTLVIVVQVICAAFHFDWYKIAFFNGWVCSMIYYYVQNNED